ncbi:acyl carrier protein [Sphaerisporangium corydalis]|uniref:Acyl carrier protein n=1 Tax=Sphaerisporangium corydalis TaxID=1441875 RepID=A0ABV9E8J2_9ACTN|nr:acyl carrier protein [Sphaerisporangium corydalis]
MRGDDSVAGRVAALMRDSMFVDPPDDTTDIVASGLIDSMGFMRLFALLEDEFGIEVRSADLRLDHFRTIERIAGFVRDKRAARQPAGDHAAT